MPKKKKKLSKSKTNYEIANEFGANNGPNETSNKMSKKNMSCHKRGKKESK